MNQGETAVFLGLVFTVVIVAGTEFGFQGFWYGSLTFLAWLCAAALVNIWRAQVPSDFESRKLEGRGP